MNINIEEYLTKEEMKEIATQEFKKHINHQARESLERIINNSAYQVVWSAVDESLDNEAKDFLKEKVIKIIGDMSAFNVFATPNAWDRKENMAHSILIQAVKDNYDQLARQVENQINTLSKTQIAKIAAEVMKEKLSKAI